LSAIDRHLLRRLSHTEAGSKSRKTRRTRMAIINDPQGPGCASSSSRFLRKGWETTLSYFHGTDLRGTRGGRRRLHGAVAGPLDCCRSRYLGSVAQNVREAANFTLRMRRASNAHPAASCEGRSHRGPQRRSCARESFRIVGSRDGNPLSRLP